MTQIEEILEKDDFTRDDIVKLLSLEYFDEIEILKRRANKALKKYVGNKIFLRGIIEFSNICRCNCCYCGIRAGNKHVKRFLLSQEEIAGLAKAAAEEGYGSIVLQSGEVNEPEFVDFAADTVKNIKSATISEKLPEGMGITLSIGEQSYESYEKLFEAGAHRFLLRIETSNEELFRKIHPPSQKYSSRVQKLKFLRDIGFQVGTGVMIGIPGQTVEHLADDILFFKDNDIDMIGMGPFLIHEHTPMSSNQIEWNKNRENIASLSLKMLAVTRLVLKDVNIASTTALDFLMANGRQRGLSYGANVMMPTLTPRYFKVNYRLYDPIEQIPEDFNLDEFAENMAELYGRRVVINEWGDSPHYFNRIKNGQTAV